MTMKNLVMKGLLLTAWVVISPLAMAASLTAQEIVSRVDALEQANTSEFTMQMILVDKKGKQRSRTMNSQSKMIGADEYKLLFFTAPANVKGTGFLTYDYVGEKEDDQWLYLPALGKSKRIAAADKSGSFMGSDFTYADMTQRNIEDYSYKLLQEKTVAGTDTWVIETTPKSQQVMDTTGYLKSYLFVRQDNFVVIQAIHMMPDNYRKYMSVNALEQIDGIWVATEIEMKTTQGKTRQHSTVLKLSNITNNQPIGDQIFSLRELVKGL
jgi:outer membrane lipoprotein-sorting protein